MTFPLKNVGVSMIVHGASPYLADILRWLEHRVEVVHVLDDVSPMYGAKDGEYNKTKACVESVGAKNVVFEVGDFGTDQGQRQEASRREYSSERLSKLGCEWVWIMDDDEVYDDAGAERMWRMFFHVLSKDSAIRGATIPMMTYWKSLHYRVDPMEELRPPVIVQTGAKYVSGREIWVKGKYLHFPKELCMMRHYSWAHSPTEAKWKIRSWGHASQMVHGWMENVFMAWTPGCIMKNLHPTQPDAYQRIVRCDLPIPECLALNSRVGKEVIEE